MYCLKHLKCFRWIAVVALAVALAPIALCPSTASAQETLSISGTFNMDALRQYQGTVGADLAEVYARHNEHWWTLTLYGVTVSHDYSYYESVDEFGNIVYYDEQYITRVHALAFDLEFFGADADVLNQVVSSQLTRGSYADDIFLVLRNGYYFDAYDEWGGGTYASWNLGLLPLDSAAGVSFYAGSWSYQFSADENGYPLVEPQRVFSYETAINDYRPGNDGGIVSYNDVVDIGSAGPPLPPSMRIEDASVLEGDRGTTRLLLNVKLSRSTSDAVTVNYQSVSGTAQAGKDYYSTVGTLTFQPNQTSATIEVLIRTDRKREANETFSVKLTSAVGATIQRGVATATILNDD